jgi:hypothetical protein
VTGVKYVSGWLLPKGINVQPQSVLVPSNASAIAEMIGCDLIDAVRHEVGSSDGDHTVIVGYVDDEGLLKEVGPQDINWLASSLFNRDEPLMGDVVVVGGVDPTTGVYDGDNHDLPSWLNQLADEVVAYAADSYNKGITTVASVLMAIQDGIIDRSEFEAIMAEDDITDDFVDMLKASLGYVAMRVEDEMNGVDDTMDDAIRKMLEGEG